MRREWASCYHLWPMAVLMGSLSLVTLITTAHSARVLPIQVFPPQVFPEAQASEISSESLVAPSDIDNPAHPVDPTATPAPETLVPPETSVSAPSSPEASSPDAPNKPEGPGYSEEGLPTDESSICPPTEPNFARWLDSLRQRAIERGVEQTTLDLALSGITLNERVQQRLSHQPEFLQQIWTYLDNAISFRRIHRGRALYEQHRELLEQVHQRYGVPGHYLVAIWGVESNFGRHQGRFSVFEVLVTLGFAGRRQDFGCRELLAALRLLETSEMVPSPLLGSWAGATGPAQFIPSTLLDKGVDFDQDGHVDLWNSMPDVFASMANLLSQSGWIDGISWGLEVLLPDDFDYSLSGLFRDQAPEFWREQGVVQAQGQPLPPLLEGRAAIWLPAGHRGPSFLVTDTFYAILGYNFSGSYALAVSVLARQIAGGDGLESSFWPRDDLPLSRGERIELQQLLLDRGYEIGLADAIIGRRTRLAIQNYQSLRHQPADGYADQALLESLREDSSLKDKSLGREPLRDEFSRGLFPGPLAPEGLESEARPLRLDLGLDLVISGEFRGDIVAGKLPETALAVVGQRP